MSADKRWNAALEVQWGRFYLRQATGREEITAESALEIASVFGPEVAERIRDQVRVNAIKARESALRSPGWIEEAVKRAHEATSLFQAAAAEAKALGIAIDDENEQDPFVQGGEG